MRSFLYFILLGFWGACVHALSSSGSRLLVVLEEDKSLYSNLWADLEGIYFFSTFSMSILRLKKLRTVY
jgi:oligosaccharyltransferase complex subunit beta